jgi:hypothetical protein
MEQQINRVRKRKGYSLVDMRLASYVRVWLALKSNATDDCEWKDSDPEFAFFDDRELHDKAPFTDKHLLDMVKKQAEVEGHKFPEDIDKTLSVMLYS